MLYIALKPCRISGKDYLINDEIDVSKLSESEIAALCKKKTIVGMPDVAGAPAASENGEPAEALFEVPVINKDEVFNINITGAQFAEVVAIIQKTADEAVKAVKEVTAEAPLILIHRLDGRKSVQEAAQKRAEELTAKPEAEELTAKPEAEELTAKPEAEELTAKPEGEELTAKPEGEELTAKPEGDAK